MNIAHYVAAFSPISHTFIYDLIVGLESRNLTTNYVLTRRRELEHERPFKNTFICKNQNPLKKILAKLSDPEHLKIHNPQIILKHLKEKKIDIIHSHFAINGLRMNDLLVSNKLSIPHICSFHGNDVLTNPHKIKGYKEALLRMNDYPNVLMTVPSQFLKNVCIDLGLKEDLIKVVFNTIHPKFIQHKPAIPWDGKKKLKIITVGRVVEMKGHEYAIKALSKLKNDFPNFKYTIVGSGNLEQSLKELTKSLGLDQNIIFLGNVSHDKVPQLLSESHLCLIPSVRARDGKEDTFCLSLVEGSVMGLYCLSSDTRGPAEVLGPNKEFIFKQKNPEALYEALQRVIQNFGLMDQEAKRLKQYMLDNFHPDNYFKNYLEVYKSLLY